MHTLAHKLKSTRGASMLFALLVFLLCLLAGTAVLTGAAANIGRYTHLEAEQQQYLSVASALDVLQGQLTDSAHPAVQVKVTYTKTESWHYENSDPTKPPELIPETPLDYSLKLESALPAAPPLNYYQTLLLQNCVPDEWHDNADASGNDDLASLLPGTPLTFSEARYTVELQDPEDAWHVYPVDVTVKDPATAGTGASAGTYPLFMELRAKTESGAAAYPLQVVWPGEVTTDIQTKVETVGALPNAMPPSGWVDGSRGTRTTTTTLTCTLRWNAEDRVVTFAAP